MVDTISSIVGIRSVYMKKPTCNYAIRNFTVTKDGTLVYDDRYENKIAKKVLEGLA